jgi:hypothetical protein
MNNSWRKYLVYAISLLALAAYFYYHKGEAKKRSETEKIQSRQTMINFDIERAACEIIEKDINRFKETPRNFHRVSEEYLIEKSIAIVRGGVRIFSDLRKEEINSEVAYSPLSEGKKFFLCFREYEIWKNFPSFSDGPAGVRANAGPAVENPQSGQKRENILNNRSRLALVIGNGNYNSKPLLSPLNDAEDVAAALEKLGFDVILLKNGNLNQMRSAIKEFGSRIASYETNIFYFSGHGIEYKGRNYLIPVDAEIKSEEDVIDQAIDTGFIMGRIELAKRGANIIIIDACRDNPFGTRVKSARSGLAPMEAPAGTIIAFATAPGRVAEDGGNRNSPYTKHLLMQLDIPRQPIERVFKETRKGVIAETKGRQIPWENTSLSEEIILNFEKTTSN